MTMQTYLLVQEWRQHRYCWIVAEVVPLKRLPPASNDHSWFNEALQKVSERCQYEQAAKQANVPALSV